MLQLSVGLLTRSGEEQDLENLLRALHRQQLQRVHVEVFVVYNDSGSPSAQLDSHMPSVSWLRPGHNLGVAGGRNALLKDERFVAADLLVFLDTDIVISDDFLRRIVEHHRHTGGEFFGVPQVTYRHAKSRQLISETPTGPRLNAQGCLKRMTSAIAPLAIAHCGATPDAVTAYTGLQIPVEDVAMRLCRWRHPRDHFRFNRSVPGVRSAFVDGTPLRASSVPGAAKVISPRVLKQVGLYDDRFNPYGMEDVDFAVRAEKLGVGIQMLTTEVFAHGTHARHLERQSGEREISFRENEYRARSIFFSKHASGDWCELLAAHASAEYARDLVSSQPAARRRLSAAMRGIRHGVQQLAGTTERVKPGALRARHMDSALQDFLAVLRRSDCTCRECRWPLMLQEGMRHARRLGALALRLDPADEHPAQPDSSCTPGLSPSDRVPNFWCWRRRLASRAREAREAAVRGHP